MNTRTYVCPRDDYPLVPVYSVEGRKRRIIALSCPEPYCDHMQLVPKDRARELERYYRHGTPEAGALGETGTEDGPGDPAPTRLVQ